MTTEVTINEIGLPDVWQVRHEVMWPEKPEDFVKLASDNSGLHYGLFFKDELVTVVSVFLVNDEMQFRKFATKTEFQGMGFGTTLLTRVFEIAGQKRLKRVWCNARLEKSSYYNKFGMSVVSEPYEKSGILYVTMEKQFEL